MTPGGLVRTGGFVYLGVGIGTGDRRAELAGEPVYSGFLMNRRLLTILLISLAISGGCAYLVYRIVGARMNASKPVLTTRVVAAATDIKLGTVLSATDLTTADIQGTVPKGVFLKPEQVIGRGVISDLYQGEPILDSRLAPAGSGGGLASTIPNGMRALAVKVDQVVGVAGFVTPGMRVDILASGNPPGATNPAEGTITKTILQNIQVLSAGTDIQKDAEGKPQQVQVVNLLVTPEQAQTLSLATSELRIQLVLRNPLDTKVSQVSSHRHGPDVWRSGRRGERPQESPQGRAQNLHHRDYQRCEYHPAKIQIPRGKAVRAKAGFSIACFSALCFFLCAGQGLRAQAAPSPSAGVSFQDSSNELSVAVGKTVLVDCVRPVTRVAIGLGDVAEASAISPTEIMVNGKAPGETSLIIWDDRGGRQFFNVTVRASASALDEQHGIGSPRAPNRASRTSPEGDTRRMASSFCAAR